MPSARVGTRQRVPAHLALGKEAFAECWPTWHSAKAIALADPNPATWQAFAECLALGKGGSFAECLTAGHSAKGTTTDAVCPGPLCRVPLFAECQALGKDPLCRVPVVCHSANLAALGKVTVSRSDT